MDILNMELINSLPQPFMAITWANTEWPVHDIDVQTGLVRFDVCGKLQTSHVEDFKVFRDLDGVEHDTEDLYIEHVK